MGQITAVASWAIKVESACGGATFILVSDSDGGRVLCRGSDVYKEELRGKSTPLLTRISVAIWMGLPVGTEELSMAPPPQGMKIGGVESSHGAKLAGKLGIKVVASRMRWRER